MQYEWPSATKLTLNMTPSLCLLHQGRSYHNSRKAGPSLTITENAIGQVTFAKSLEVYIDQNINWECHIENISKKIACAIGTIKRLGHLHLIYSN